MQCNVLQSSVTQDGNDHYFDEIRSYLLIGKDLFNEMKRNTFSAQESYAEVLCSRCRAFMQGLVSISRSPLWPQQIVDNFCQVIAEFQRLHNIYQERFDGFSGEDYRYCCTSETQHAPGKGRPKFLIPMSQLVGLRSPGRQFQKCLVSLKKLFYVVDMNFPCQWVKTTIQI